MDYCTLVNEAIEFMENNLNRNISVEELSNRYYISKYYFLRIFKALTDQTVKEYLDRRRLSEAAKALGRPEKKVLDVALDFGFESHEAFTRSFKKVFLLSPSEYRKTGKGIRLFDKTEVVERDFKNLNRDLVVDFKVIQQPAVTLACRRTTFDPMISASIDRLTPFTKKFLSRYNKDESLDALYNIAGSDREKNAYNFYAGFRVMDTKDFHELEKVVLPGSNYAAFSYSRDMGEIHTTIMKDICRSIMVSGLNLKKSGFDYIMLFERSYLETGQYTIFVPLLQ